MYAFDYIIKPFNIDRIHNTLDRIIETYKQNKVILNYQNLITLVSNKLIIKNKDGIKFIDMNEIILIREKIPVQ